MQYGHETSGGVRVSAGHYWFGGWGDAELDPSTVLRVRYARHQIGGVAGASARMKRSAMSCSNVIPRPAQTTGLTVTIVCSRPTSQSTSSVVTTAAPGAATAPSDCETALLLPDDTPLGLARRCAR